MLLVVFNNPGWAVVSRLSDLQFLWGVYTTLRPYLSGGFAIFRDWGWVGGVGLLLWVWSDARRESGSEQPVRSAESQQPVVAVYEHIKAYDSPLLKPIIAIFKSAGWQVETPGTSVERHESGIWIHGGTYQEQAIAMLALRTLGLTPLIDKTDDDPPMLQIVVGQTETSQAAAVKPIASATKHAAPSRGATVDLSRTRPNDLNGELEIRLHPEANVMSLQLKNINPAGPKKEISAFLDDLRRWAPEVSTFVEVQQVAQSPKPLELVLRAGTREIFYGQKQFYDLIPGVDGAGTVSIPFKNRGTIEHVRIQKGLWLWRVRVTWNDRAYVDEYFVRFESPYVAPEIVPDPRHGPRD